MGDRASARLELDSARETLASLGAGADLAERSARAGDWVALDGADGAHLAEGALSVRELQVLAHVADGKTNRQVADDLSISPHTVRRHLENIFAKLGVSGRAAATAYAYEHDLL
jgi:DNA-binding CsgD family transcriptional regulator